MPLLTPGDTHIHHHSLLAGVGAATAAVLGCFALVLGVWHRVSGEVAVAVTVLVFALVAVILAVALYVVVRLGLLVRHHVAHPETLTRHAIRAEVIPGKALPAAESPAVPAPAPVAAIAPPLARIVGMGRTWRPLDDPDTYRTAFPGTAGDATTTEGK